MEIVLKEKEKHTKFSKIAQGDCFMYDGDLYIKVDELELCGGLFCNAVCLDDGGHVYIGMDETVTIPNVKIVEE